LFFRYLRH